MSSWNFFVCAMILSSLVVLYHISALLINTDEIQQGQSFVSLNNTKSDSTTSTNELEPTPVAASLNPSINENATELKKLTDQNEDKIESAKVEITESEIVSEINHQLEIFENQSDARCENLLIGNIFKSGMKRIKSFCPELSESNQSTFECFSRNSSDSVNHDMCVAKHGVWSNSGFLFPHCFNQKQDRRLLDTMVGRKLMYDTGLPTVLQQSVAKNQKKQIKCKTYVDSPLYIQLPDSKDTEGNVGNLSLRYYIIVNRSRVC